MSQFYTFCGKVGHRIFTRFIDQNGKRRQKTVRDFPFELFIKGRKSDSVSLYGDSLSRVEFEDVSSMSDFVKEYKGATKIYGQTSAVHQYIAKTYPGKIEFDASKFVVLNFDIEVRHDEGFPDPQRAAYEILSISMKVFGRDQKITLGLKPFKPERDQDIYDHCQDEAQLLRRFLGYWKRINPDIITGWNIDGFDIPYLINRMRQVLGVEVTNELSPFHKETKHVFTEITVGKFKEESYRILGVTSYDYQRIYMKFAPKKLERYTLDFVGETELEERKVDLSAFNNDLMRLYNEDFNKFVQYNEQDVNLVERLDQRLQFMRLTITVALMTHSQYHEALATVKPWDNMIYNMLLERNIQIPPEEFPAGKEIVGAFVKAPIPARYEWVVALDLTSLYPTICRMYNMSPETLMHLADEIPMDRLNAMLAGEFCIEDRLAKGWATAANGSSYSQDKEGILAFAMTYVFDERKRVKKQMLKTESEKETGQKSNALNVEEIHNMTDLIAELNAKQLALKTLANGGYGALANKAFRYFNTNIAEGITMTGQLTIRYIYRKMNEFLNAKFGTDDFDYVITCDTDSAYLNLEKFVHTLPAGLTKNQIVDAIDVFVKTEVEPMLEKEFTNLANKLGVKKNLMDMKRESISDVGIFRGKKNYILQVYDNEGVRYSKPVLKMVGIETAKSSTPYVVRKELEKSLDILVNGNNEDLLSLIENFRKTFYTLPLSKTASPRGVSELDKYKTNGGPFLYKKGAPFHVKAALHYNDLVLKKGIDNRHPLIRNGSKIKFISLKIPNPVRNDRIAFIDELPEEFGLHSYVDIASQFEDVFVSPLKSFTDIIGWDVKKTATLKGLFM